MKKLVKKTNQKGVNEAVVQILSDHGLRLSQTQKSVNGIDKRLQRIERWAFYASGALAVLVLWWEVDLKERFFGREKSNTATMELVLQEIKSLKQKP